MSKKSAKTPEELLKEALVPKEEQPYEVPRNWIWVTLKTISNGTRRGIEPSQYPNEIFELYSIPSFASNEPEILTGEEINSNKQLVEEDDVLICKINPRINRVWKVNKYSKYRQIGSTEWIVIPNNKKLNAKYLMYLFRSPYFRSLLTANVSGVGGSLTRARPKDVEKYPVALPPLNEQKRIADKVEGLLDKINQAKQLIEEAKETFELRRAAILDEAFRGELTKKWREENVGKENAKELVYRINSSKLDNVEVKPFEIPDTWEWCRLGDLFHVQVGSTPSRKEYQFWDNGELPWVSSGEVAFRHIFETKEKVTSMAVEKARLKLVPKGSVLFGMIGEGKTRGQVAILEIDAYHNQNVASIWVSQTEMDSYYVYYWLLSQYTKNRQNSSGNNQPAYNKARVQDLLIPIAPISEQKEILRIISRQFTIETEINNKLDLLSTLEGMKQAVLRDAFTGQLGTNNIMEKNGFIL